MSLKGASVPLGGFFFADQLFKTEGLFAQSW